MRPLLLAIAWLSFGVAHARAEYLYDNGPINGTIGGFSVGRVFHVNSAGEEVKVSNSFTLEKDSILTGAQLGLWTHLEAAPVSLDWSIGTTPFGADMGFGTVNLNNTFHNLYGGRSAVHSSAFPLNTQLASGAYWLTIEHAKATDGLKVFWDANKGPSSAFISYVAPPEVLPIVSESFQILGHEAIATPEPGSLTLIVIGITGISACAWRRRENAKRRQDSCA